MQYFYGFIWEYAIVIIFDFSFLARLANLTLIFQLTIFTYQFKNLSFFNEEFTEKSKRAMFPKASFLWHNIWFELEVINFVITSFMSV